MGLERGLPVPTPASSIKTTALAALAAQKRYDSSRPGVDAFKFLERRLGEGLGILGNEERSG